MPSGLFEFAEIAVPLPVDATFTYAIPAALKDDVRLGARVEVPWGNRVITGFVVGFPDEANVELKRVRDIRAVLDDDEPALLPDIIELCRWASSYYLAPIGEVLRVALPANMSSRAKRQGRRTGTEDELRAALSTDSILEADIDLWHSIGKSFDASKIIRAQPGARAALKRLRDAGLVSIDDEMRDAAGVRFDRFAILRIDPGDVPGDQGDERPRSAPTEKQQALLEFLRKHNGEAPVRAIEAAELSTSSLHTLERKGFVVIEKRARKHTLDGFFADLESVAVGDLKHSPEQTAAIAAIRESLGTFSPFLLQGVTGSGKTEVYIEAMREVVRRGEQAILLVPEISLTPVFAARLKERFGDRIAILHSNLSASERYDQWWRARRGLVDVAIGPRSALFTPFQQLGLIVVDEEGDSAYKQEEIPRYNARDLAVVRAQLRNIPAVLGSATPSLESRENATRGKYRMLRLASRVEARSLPQVEVVDIRKEKGEKEDRGLIIFSARLREELTRVFDAGEQAMILMNRRGYAPFLLCRQCDNDFRCRDCSVAMTVHRREGQLICHYCGHRKPIPTTCPACGGEVLQPIGFAIEKVEERFKLYFPDVSVAVLDRDAAKKRGELVRILDRFRSGETKALIGTQIISKGHHFPLVTLTGVINADSILGYPDFRSAEKTFYLLTQVAGRSGRGDLEGKVVIQSAFPHHYAVQCAIAHDYERFYREEIEFRTKFRYPPMTQMISILYRGEREESVQREAAAAGQRLEIELMRIRDARIQGPAAAPIARIKGVFRYQILLRSAQRAALRNAVRRAILQHDLPAGIEAVIDVDPINIL